MAAVGIEMVMVHVITLKQGLLDTRFPECKKWHGSFLEGENHDHHCPHRDRQFICGARVQALLTKSSSWGYTVAPILFARTVLQFDDRLVDFLPGFVTDTVNGSVVMGVVGDIEIVTGIGVRLRPKILKLRSLRRGSR